MQTKTIIITIVLITILIAGAVVFFNGKESNNSGAMRSDNITMVDGKQVIAIDVKGGYFPKVTDAKAGVPTVIKLNTQGTFDCSSAITIPSLSYRNNLPPSGETTVDVPAQNAGSIMRGICAMGMYSFTINYY